MIFLYNIVIFVILLLAMPFIIFCVVFDTFQVRDRLGFRLPPLTDNRPVWLHAASVGESKVALAFIRYLRKTNPDIQVAVSTQTATGLKILRENGEDINSFIAPTDFSWTLDLFIKRLNPRSLIIIETELWPNLIARASGAGIPVAIVNGSISSRSYRKYFFFRWFFSKTFAFFSTVCVQSEDDRERFINIGADPQHVHVLGNMKFDVVISGKGNSDTIRKDLNIVPDGGPAVVFGSIRKEEESIIIESVRILLETNPSLFIALAPRYIERARIIAKLLKDNGLEYSIRSSGPHKSGVYIIDTMGELQNFYSIADVAYVGGSLSPIGGHNPLEPAMFGKPVLFGPYMEQKGTRELLDSGGARIVHDAQELSSVIIELIENEDLRCEMGEKSAQTHFIYSGVIKRVIDHLSRENIV